jgi:hypothetical protein
MNEDEAAEFSPSNAEERQRAFETWPRTGILRLELAVSLRIP